MRHGPDDVGVGSCAAESSEVDVGGDVDGAGLVERAAGTVRAHPSKGVVGLRKEATSIEKNLSVIAALNSNGSFHERDGWEVTSHAPWLSAGLNNFFVPPGSCNL